MSQSQRVRKAYEGRDYRKSVDSCLAKVAEDEPIFVLRAQDILAPLVVSYWASLCESMGVAEEKIMGARVTANQMKKWPNRKMPD